MCRRYGGAEMLEKHRVRDGGGGAVSVMERLRPFCLSSEIERDFFLLEMFDYVKRLESCHVGEVVSVWLGLVDIKGAACEEEIEKGATKQTSR